jgi:glycosyltransferase involved in cell wall biosynthesis
VSRRLLVVEPYHGGSHRAFLEAVLARVPWEADLLTMPPRKWKWRMSAAAITLSEQALALHAEGRRWDLVLASTFVNLPEFLGLARDAVAGVPSLVYFHENQLAYPNRHSADWDRQYPLTNVKSALAADVCAFNSAYNLDSMLAELPAFLRRFPDEVPAGVPERIRERSVVLAPPFEASALDAAPLVRGAVPRIVWPHRWDHDKDPETFFAVMAELAAEGLAFEVAVAGQPHDNVRARFGELTAPLGERLVALGDLTTREAYAALLRSCDIAVSTAQHEFFGLAMMEATYAGCFPLVPDRLAYPELYPAECRYADGAALAARLRALLAERPAPGAHRALADRSTIEALAPAYAALLDRAASSRR